MIRRIAAGVVVFACVVVGSACVLDVEDPSEQTAEDRATYLAGTPCATACEAVASGACDWSEQCSDGWPNLAFCEGIGLGCDAAEHAALGTRASMEYCWRDCQNLH